MRRPSLKSNAWKAHERQALTYAWLRKKQIGKRKVVAGILIYINELCPSEDDMEQLYEEISEKSTDVMPEPEGDDKRTLLNWKKKGAPPTLSEEFRKKRSIRIIPIDCKAIRRSLREFDKVVYEIEKCIMKEAKGGSIKNAWPVNPAKRNCDICDFRTFCQPDKYSITVP